MKPFLAVLATALTFAAGAAHAQWNDLSRGAKQWITGPDDEAKALGMNPVLSGARTEDEGLFVIQHSQWAERMARAIQDERAALASQQPLAAE